MGLVEAASLGNCEICATRIQASTLNVGQSVAVVACIDYYLNM